MYRFRSNPTREFTTYSDRLLVKEGNFTGWYHHLGEKKRIGISSSAYGVHALSLLVPHSPLIRNVSDSILKDGRRFDQTNGENREIAWSMAHEPTAPLVEPTCYVVQQLNLAGTLEKDAPEARAAVSWLLGQQQIDSWGPQKSLTSYVYVTALVCQVLASLAPESTNLAMALRWLEKARNDDFGWGERPSDQRSRVWCTAHVALAFLLAQPSVGIGNQVPGVPWLREQHASWMEPYFVEYEFDIPNDTRRRGRANYRFDALPIVLQVLVRSGLRPLAPDLLKGVHRLLAQQVEGVWIYPSSNQKTIFNLSHAVEALTEFRRTFQSPAMFADIYEQIQIVEHGQNQQSGIPMARVSKLGFVGATVLILALMPLIWVFTGKQPFGRLWNDFTSAVGTLGNNPVPIIGSLSLIFLGAGLLGLVQKKTLWILWGLLSTLAFILSVHWGPRCGRSAGMVSNCMGPCCDDATSTTA